MENKDIKFCSNQFIKLKEIAHKFEYIGAFSENGYAFAREKGSSELCIINIEGIITGKINSVTAYPVSFSEDIGVIFIDKTKNTWEGRLYGAVNIYGEFIIDPIYDSIDAFTAFTNGLAIAKKDCLHGVINKNNEVLIPFENTWLDFNPIVGIGYAVKLSEDKKRIIRIIDIEGEEFIIEKLISKRISYDEAREILKQDMTEIKRVRDIRVEEDGFYYIRKSLFKQPRIYKFTEEGTVVYCFYLDELSIEPLVYTDEEHLIIRQEIKSPIYEEIKSPIYAYRDLKGDGIFVGKEKTNLESFNNGFGIIYNYFKDDNSKMIYKYSFINNKFQVVMPFIDDTIYKLDERNRYNKNLALFGDYNHKGLIDVDGNEIIPAQYSTIDIIHYGVACCIDKQRNLTIELF